VRPVLSLSDERSLIEERCVLRSVSLLLSASLILSRNVLRSASRILSRPHNFILLRSSLEFLCCLCAAE
jgi:hypothetical protein